MKRRDLIKLLGGAAVGMRPVAAWAQQAGMPVIGFLNLGFPEASAHLAAAFRKGLSEVGYVEGGNVTIDYRWAQGDNDRLPGLAADLVRRRVAVIAVTNGGSTAQIAKAVATTVPIVFGSAGDPVKIGLVASLNRPGGNLTGISNMDVELGPKRLGLLRELLPGAAHFSVLVNPNSASAETVTELRAAVSRFGGQIDILSASTNRDIDLAFASIAQNRADGLLVNPSPLFGNRRVQLVTLAARHGVPVMFYDRPYAEAGGLMSYGSSITDQAREVGIYTGRVLKGEKPADLPVLQASKFEFVINLQTARTLGIEVPAMLLAQADEVIE